MSKVALIKGKNRSENIRKVLALIKEEIIPKIKKVKEVTIKPNMVTVHRQLAATHREAIKAFLVFLAENDYRGKIVIAENSAIGSAMEGFKNYRYNELKKEFDHRFADFQFVDLGSEEAEEKTILDRVGRPLKVLVAKRILETEYLVSINPPKTHDTVIVTLSIKNIVMGSVLKYGNRFYNACRRKILGNKYHTDYKAKMHQGYKMTNRNIASLFKEIPIHLSIIDGAEAMEGDGPVSGTVKCLDWALASADALAADAVAAKLMGFDPLNIGYLFYLGANLNDIKNDIKIVGNGLKECAGSLKPHRTYREQLKWKINV